ncbi:MAG TPA: acyl-CoA dehydrogenase [Syntrophomonas sp.]|nr:acyl-CoA dehydrogenase [Syntrophomonas sp.]
MASNFIYSNRDLKFIVKEWLGTERLLGFEKFRDYYGMDDVDVILDQGLKIVTEQIAPTNEDGDTLHAQFKDGTVTVPPSFHPIYKFINEEGWGIGNLLEEGEGTLPQILYSSFIEMITSANPAWIPYLNLSGGVLELIQAYGREKDKEIFLPPLCSGEWSGTMCLTEAVGGSDVGDILSKAYPTDEPGIYKIKGTKIFITAGDHDICSNIIHMVLARIEGARPGTKGLSLFIVPKFRVNEDGSLGEPNDVITVGIEHKLGLKGSSTASLSFGENNSCLGILMGEPPLDGMGEGMAQMFQMMNGARMDTGMAGYCVATQAYNNAAEYAKIRVQGRSFKDPKAGRVPIIKHADIRRILLNIKSCTDAMRAMAFKTYFYFDLMRHSPDEAERQMARDRIEVMTPLVKAYSTDMAWPLIGDAIQVYGGYGFIEEYPVAHFARDSKIYSLWEGTNFIQSQDLVGRKWTLNKGRLFQDWLDDLEGMLHAREGREEFKTEYAIMQAAFASYKRIKASMDEFGQTGKGEMLPLYATRLLHATSQLCCGTLILDQAAIAMDKIKELGQDHWDFAFYQGKIDGARFYIKNTVPSIMQLEVILQYADDSALLIPEESLGV